MTVFALMPKERMALEHLAAHTVSAKSLRRAQALLWLDAGEKAHQVAERLGFSRQTLYNWATHFRLRNELDISMRVADGKRSGRRRTAHGVIDPLIDAVIDDDPHTLGYRSTVWTAPLLVEYLSDAHDVEVSCSSVRLAIGRLRIRWKRPRHVLALRPSTWRQAKGG